MTMQNEKVPPQIDPIAFFNEVEARVQTLEALAQGLTPMLEKLPRPGAVLTDEEITDADEAVRRLFAFTGLLSKGLRDFLQYLETIRR